MPTHVRHTDSVDVIFSGLKYAGISLSRFACCAVTHNSDVVIIILCILASTKKRYHIKLYWFPRKTDDRLSSNSFRAFKSV